MYGLTRGPVTLIAMAVAGALVWGATQVAGGGVGRYWATVALFAAAGLVMALSQLLGGWTKWGWPRVSPLVFLVGFLPTLVVVGWILCYAQPDANWLQRHSHTWSGDLGIAGWVYGMSRFAVLGTLSFGLGLVFGFVFDTTGPRTEPVFRRRAAAGPGVVAPTTRERREPVAREDTAATRVERPSDSAETRVNPPEHGPGP